MILHVALVEQFYARELAIPTKSRDVANGLNGEIKTYLQCRIETRRKKDIFQWSFKSHEIQPACNITHCN